MPARRNPARCASTRQRAVCQAGTTITSQLPWRQICEPHIDRRNGMSTQLGTRGLDHPSILADTAHGPRGVRGFGGDCPAGQHGFSQDLARRWRDAQVPERWARRDPRSAMSPRLASVGSWQGTEVGLDGHGRLVPSSQEYVPWRARRDRRAQGTGAGMLGAGLNQGCLERWTR